MDHRFYEGKLVRWDDERGFGFIQSSDRAHDIFLHISALQSKTRRPVVGDVIFYQLHVEKDGKCKALAARIQGVSESWYQPSSGTRKKYTPPGRSSRFPCLVLLVLLGVAGATLSDKFNLGRFKSFVDSRQLTQATGHAPVAVRATAASTTQPRYTCAGKVHCSQMASCEEALFYQSHCPGTKMDGDHDGKPCEDRCGH